MSYQISPHNGNGSKHNGHGPADQNNNGGNKNSGKNKRRTKYLTKLDQIPELTGKERNDLAEVTDKFIFRSNDYYQSLINWDDPDDPIRRLIVPDIREMDEWGQLDASQEETYTATKGLEHKYKSTALLLVNEVCAAYCRFCFRKRLFMDDNDEVTKDISQGLEYIRNHKEINNILLTGGDPLIMSTDKLGKIIAQLRGVEHVQIIRIGTKIPAFNPFRIIDDPSLLKMIEKYSTDRKKIYIMAHFNHPRELTNEAVKALNLLMKAGATLVNQTPIIKGVNDDSRVLKELFENLSFIGVPPYYVFQCRPTLGNKGYVVPLETSFQIVEEARNQCSGLAKRAKLVMSHSSGKVEMVGLTDNQVFFKYHRTADEKDNARFMAFKRNPRAFWFDDYLDTVPEPSLACS